MKTTHVLLLALLTLAGCDGHVETLYLRPPGANRPPLLTPKSHILPVHADEDVVGVVSRVSAEMGLAPEPQTAHTWQMSYTAYKDIRWYFWIRAVRDKEGYWQVALVDFPTSARSDYSKTAEQKLRAALRQEEAGGISPSCRENH